MQSLRFLAATARSSDDYLIDAAIDKKKKKKGEQRRLRGRSPSRIDNDTGGAYPSDTESDTKRKKAKKYRMRLLGKKKKHRKRDDSLESGRGGSVPRTGGGARYANSIVPDEIRSGTESIAQRANHEADTRKVAANESNKKIRIKPSHAFASTTYMNEAELYKCMTAPSDEFEFLTSYLNPSTKLTRKVRVSDVVRQHFGSPREDGRIGSLRAEVMGCVGLDRAKPDVAVYLVAGDCAFTTDTITGIRSPMWPNSAKRACVFPIHHVYAKLFIGVFDLKQKKNTEADYFCGRVAIDIPQLRPDTEYDITFPLRASSFIYDRRPRGVVRLRFSLHWFSERAAILSALKRPRNPLAFSRQAKKFPTIPCGDPKTFRNVAVTVHGQDFPGKYTRGSFRATMREFNLYQQNLRFLFKVTILDCILYENPLMSLYLFVTTMYSVWLNSVRYVPPFFTGWIIYIMLENYINHCAITPGHLGFKPLTIQEIFLGLVKNDKTSNELFFKPILVKKRARNSVIMEDGKRADIELSNHREFPFSERFEYHKFSAAEAIAPSPSKKSKGTKENKAGTDLRTARRLSVYTSPVDDEEESYESESDSDADSDADRDDEGMMDQADDGYENLDSDDEDEDDHFEGGGERAGFMGLGTGKASLTRRIRVGPAQNSDTSGRKVPPQVHLSKVEHMMHRLTKNISVEHVHFPPPHLQMQLGKEINAKGPASDVITQKEKQNFDDFDKLLGFRTKNPNPILRITSSFLGPLMRMIRIVIYATRIAFNLTAWRDPYITFWIFAFFCVLTFILLIFPWRTFFFLLSLVLLGPQNIAIRKYLERRAKEKEEEERQMKERERALAAAEMRSSMTEHVPLQKMQQPAAEPDPVDKKGKKGKMKWGRSKGKKEEAEEEINEAELFQSPRPAFCANARGTKRTQVPRDVAVPYFRFRKDRFYDWPPDPTVSRATPLLVTASKDREIDEDDFDVSTRYPFHAEENKIHNSSTGKRETSAKKRHNHSHHHHHNKSKHQEEDEDFGYGY